MIVKLKPPTISTKTISKKIVCTRPMREGKFNLSVKQQTNKMIVNCYGHGGSGWTTLFGCAHRVIELFLADRSSKQIPIRVIGSGCMGLTVAIELSRLGYNVVGISTKSLYEIPSWQAAGYFALVSVKPSREDNRNLHAIGLDTFQAYQSISQGRHPYITQDVLRLLPVYCGLDTESGLEALETQGMIPPKEFVSLDFGNGIIRHDFVKYMTYFIATTTLMDQLTVQINQLKIPIEIKEIKSFAEVNENIIFNCSGMGGRELNEDEMMIPVRGHLTLLNKEAGQGHMDYMIYTQVKQDGKDESIYAFPKSSFRTSEGSNSCSGVLGGTFIPHVDRLSINDQHKLDKIEFERMLERNSQFFHGKSFNSR